jgi:poly-gamma-glutamate synthesis protein (capsule biosynthesis protein)
MMKDNTMKKFFIALLATIFLCGVGAAVFFVFIFENEIAETAFEIEESEPLLQEEIYIEEDEAEEIFEEIEIEEEDTGCAYTVTILLSAAGDTTLGGDSRWSGYRAFMRAYEENGVEYFLANTREIFFESDIALVNLEGVLTETIYPHREREFVFRGPPHFAQILTAGHVNVVSLANNHTLDFFEEGFDDTREALSAVGVAYFGNEINLLTEINGVQVGFFGHRAWADWRENRNLVTAAIEDLRERGAQLIIAYFHWGTENETTPEQYQISLGRFTIDAGADLVLGAHSHVIQGIEVYNGRNIVYSLANFCFGGNSAPHDMDSFIFQQEFTFYHGELQPCNITNIIPIRVSTLRYQNDFRPTPAQGAEAERILERIERYGAELGD